MESYEIRTVPARLPARAIVIGIVYAGLLGFLVFLAVRTTVLILGSAPDWSSEYPVLATLLGAQYGVVWLFVRTCGPTIQVVGLYLMRDRGQQPVAYRLDASGWHHVFAGTDVVIPWRDMTAEVLERTDDHYHLRLTSSGPVGAAWDPASRQVKRTLRKQRGLTTMPLTNSNPKEDELAAAIARVSAGAVVLTR